MSLRRIKEAQIYKLECTLADNGVLYTYRVYDNGIRERVSNQEAYHCTNIIPCRVSDMCDKSQMQAAKQKYPCKLKYTVFSKQEESDEYCELRAVKPKGPYKKSQRKQVVKRANIELYGLQQKPKKKISKKKVKKITK